jgi:FkbM family methyltransferase
LIEKYFYKGYDVIELGASLGVVSAHICQRAEPGRRIVIVEANPNLIPTVRVNVSKFTDNLNVRIANAVVSGITGVRQMDMILINNNAAYAVLAGAEHESSAARVTVATISLGELLRAYNVVEPYVLVMDIEGSELEVLENGGSALDGCRQLFLECHSVQRGEQGHSAQDVLDLAEVRGFRIVERVARSKDLIVAYLEKRFG